MVAQGKMLVSDRLFEVERAVKAFDGQLREARLGLAATRTAPLTTRLWRNLIGARFQDIYMSAVCNRNVRPNTKIVSHVGA
ncbi:MAG: hypothetical protein U0412_01505 [Nitrospira sp.]